MGEGGGGVGKGGSGDGDGGSGLGEGGGGLGDGVGAARATAVAGCGRRRQRRRGDVGGGVGSARAAAGSARAAVGLYSGFRLIAPAAAPAPPSPPTTPRCRGVAATTWFFGLLQGVYKARSFTGRPLLTHADHLREVRTATTRLEYDTRKVCTVALSCTCSKTQTNKNPNCKTPLFSVASVRWG